MAFCGKCGAQLAEDEKFCPNCGAAAEQGGNVVTKAKEVLNTEDTTGEYDPQDINANKGISVLSYLGILVLIPLLTKKDSKFAQFHARQGVTLLAVDILYGIVAGLLGLIKVNKTSEVWGIPYTIKVTPWPITLILTIGWIIIGVLAIIGIVNAATGKAKKLPIIGNIDVVGMFEKK